LRGTVTADRDSMVSCPFSFGDIWGSVSVVWLVISHAACFAKGPALGSILLDVLPRSASLLHRAFSIVWPLGIDWRRRRCSGSCVRGGWGKNHTLQLKARWNSALHWGHRTRSNPCSKIPQSRIFWTVFLMSTRPRHTDLLLRIQDYRQTVFPRADDDHLGVG